MKCWKLHGAGNDFLIMDNRDQILKDEEKSALTARICDRHFGIGADGFMALEHSKTCDLKMSYYNADGSLDTMCGNGIRCLAKFARDIGAVEKEAFTVETLDGVKQIRILSETPRKSIVEVDMGGYTFDKDVMGIDCQGPEFMEETVTMQDGTEFQMSCVRLGVPHGVIFVEDDRDYPELYGSEIENLPIFLKDMNINFTRYLGPDHIEVKTWERGSGKTLACGTGSSSAAVITSRLKETAERIRVTVPGGELAIRFQGTKVLMEGPAEKIAEIWIEDPSR